MKTDFDHLDKILAQIRERIWDQRQQFKVLNQMRDLLVSKGADYSHGQDSTWANFLLSADVGSLTVDQVFLALIGTKIARLAYLSANTEEPNFESLADTWLDLANYIVLLLGYKRSLEATPE